MQNQGTVSTISRYPVKSMRGEALDTVAIDFVGLPFDRAFAFVQDGVLSPFPWFTGRECPQLLQCQPTLSDDRWPQVRVVTPDGEFDLASPEFKAKLQEWSGLSASLRTDYRGCQDVAYVSIISSANIRALTEAG